MWFWWNKYLYTSLFLWRSTQIIASPSRGDTYSRATLKPALTSQRKQREFDKRGIASQTLCKHFMFSSRIGNSYRPVIFWTTDDEGLAFGIYYRQLRVGEAVKNCRILGGVSSEITQLIIACKIYIWLNIKYHWKQILYASKYFVSFIMYLQNNAF